jgi:hypothetical protein
VNDSVQLPQERIIGFGIHLYGFPCDGFSVELEPQYSTTVHKLQQNL